MAKGQMRSNKEKKKPKQDKNKKKGGRRAVAVRVGTGPGPAGAQSLRQEVAAGQARRYHVAFKSLFK